MILRNDCGGSRPRGKLWSRNGMTMRRYRWVRYTGAGTAVAGMVQLETRSALRVWASAVVAAAGVPVCRLVFGGHLGGTTLAEAVVLAATAFTLTAVCARVGGRHGFMVLWVLMLATWVMMFRAAVIEAYWTPFAVATLIPERFVVWSMMALPLALATAFFVRGPGSRGHGTVTAGAAVWLALLSASSFLSRYAVDVGNTARWDPVVAWPVGVLSVAAAFVVPAWFLRRLRGAACMDAS